MFDASPPAGAPAAVCESAPRPAVLAPKLRPETKTMWCAALRSGKYHQVCGYLGKPAGSSHCAIGVLWAELGYPYIGAGGKFNALDFNQLFKRDEILALFRRLAGEQRVPMNEIIHRNDLQGLSFEQIADYIEWRL